MIFFLLIGAYSFKSLYTIYILRSMCTCVCACVWVCVCVCVCVCVNECVCVCVRVSVNEYVYAALCQWIQPQAQACVNACVHTFSHVHKTDLLSSTHVHTPIHSCKTCYCWLHVSIEYKGSMATTPMQPSQSGHDMHAWKYLTETQLQQIHAYIAPFRWNQTLWPVHAFLNTCMYSNSSCMW